MTGSKQIKTNRHTRRAQAKLEGKDFQPYKTGKRHMPVGYRGQRFEVRCTFEGKHGYRVGWADTADGCARLLSFITRHPSMEDGHVIELTEKMKEELRAAQGG